MSKKVILSAPQSGRAGVFSDQLLTRLMVILFFIFSFSLMHSRTPHPPPFSPPPPRLPPRTLLLFLNSKSLVLACFICHFLALSPPRCLCSASPLTATALPAAAPHHLFFHANTVLFLPHYPPLAATRYMQLF